MFITARVGVVVARAIYGFSYQQQLCAEPSFMQLACSARDHWAIAEAPQRHDVTPAESSVCAYVVSAISAVGGCLRMFWSSSSGGASSRSGGASPSPSGNAPRGEVSAATLAGVTVAKLSYSSLGVNADLELGSGAFGVVYAGTLNSKPVAVKKLHLSSVGKMKSAQATFLEELKLMSKLGEHRNLIKLVGYCDAPLALVLEFAELGSLAHVLHHEQDPAVESNMLVGKLKKLIALQVADGLRAMHNVYVVHRDVKSDNSAWSRATTVQGSWVDARGR